MVSKQAKVKNFLRNHYKYILFCLILLGINAAFIYILRSKLGGSKLLFLTPLLLLQLLLCFLGFWLKEKKHWPIHRLYLLFASILGFCYLVAMPLGAPPDEGAQFRRAYEISEGHFLSDRADNGRGGRMLPHSIYTIMESAQEPNYYDKIPHLIEESSNDTSESFQDFATMSLYSPIVYFPQVIGILVGRFLHLPMFFIIYLARACNLIFWLIVSYFSIKHLPTGKTALALFALSPILLQSTASCQVDAITNAVTIGLFAFVFSKIKRPTTFTSLEKIILTALVILVSMAKIVYLPLCLLVCLIPKQCFKSKKDKIIKISLLALVAVGLNLAWLSISAGYLVEFQPGVDSATQVQHILHSPFHFLLTIFKSINANGLYYLFTLFGSAMGALNIYLSNFYILAFIFFLFYTYLAESRPDFVLNLKQRMLIIFSILTCTLLIFTSLYVQWTEVDAELINGIQGRYFIPLLPIAITLLPPLATKKRPHFTPYAFAFGAAISLYALSHYIAYYL